MKLILKSFFLFLALFIVTPFSNAYNSDGLKTFYVESPDTWTSVYTVPEGKDLIITQINSDDINEEIELRNATGAILASVKWKTEYLQWYLVITDELQIQSTPWTNVDIMLFWFEVSEDEDVTNYIEWNTTAWNKHIFDKEDIEFIYRREFILFFILTAIKFMSIIIWRPINIF